MFVVLNLFYSNFNKVVSLSILSPLHSLVRFRKTLETLSHIRFKLVKRECVGQSTDFCVGGCGSIPAHGKCTKYHIHT